KKRSRRSGTSSFGSVTGRLRRVRDGVQRVDDALSEPGVVARPALAALRRAVRERWERRVQRELRRGRAGCRVGRLADDRLHLAGRELAVLRRLAVAEPADDERRENG